MNATLAAMKVAASPKDHATEVLALARAVLASAMETDPDRKMVLTAKLNDLMDEIQRRA